jgi:hypothetical protein
MSPLRPGTYVARYQLRFALGRHAHAAGVGRSGALKLVYRLEATS